MQFPLELVRETWADCVHEEFSVSHLAERMIEDGGVDFHGVPAEGLKNFMINGDLTYLSGLAFGCSELLAFYLASDETITAMEIVGAVTAMIIVRLGIDAGIGDWEFEFDKIVEVLVRCKDALDYEIRMKILGCLFADAWALGSK